MIYIPAVFLFLCCLKVTSGQVTLLIASEMAPFALLTALISNDLKAMALAASPRNYSWPSFILTRFLVPRRSIRMAEDHNQLAVSKIYRRTNIQQRRTDFMVLVPNQGILVQCQEGKGMTLPEIESTFSMLIVFG